jgi:starch synthase
LNESLKILYLAAEAAPYVKVGGLGDVSSSLPKALIELNDTNHNEFEIDIRLVIPFHGGIRQRGYLLEEFFRFSMEVKKQDIPIIVYKTALGKLPVFLISAPMIDVDGAVYTSDTEGDGYKFTLFSLAALELARQIDWKPDILHVNDWHTSLAAYAIYLQKSKDPFFENIAIVLGVHNLPFLGVGAGTVLKKFDLIPAYNSDLPRWAQDAPLALGLLSADKIVTVSPSYAQEILTPEYSSGLYYFLLSRADDIIGILNGLDIDYWNPDTDQYLYKNYNLTKLSNREENKTALQRELNLPIIADAPLLAVISRMDQQKGIDLVFPALNQLSQPSSERDQTWQMVILGTGNPSLEVMACQLEAKYPDKIRTLIRFDTELSHRIYAGADMLLIPSRYEPCGLTQMIAMHYGCIPIARSTGGLRDTVVDYDQSKENGNGFLFKKALAQDFSDTLQRAFKYYSSKNDWRTLQLHGMKADFSWQKSACQYLRLYQSLINRNSRFIK